MVGIGPLFNRSEGGLIPNENGGGNLGNCNVTTSSSSGAVAPRGPNYMYKRQPLCQRAQRVTNQHTHRVKTLAQGPTVQ